MEKERSSHANREATADCASPPIDHLTQSQLHRLMEVFKRWNESAATPYVRKVRGRYWLAFLMLRFTGARIGEILSVNDSSHIDFSQNEIRIVAGTRSSGRSPARVIPVPAAVVALVSRYRSEFPGMRGRVFTLDPGNFRRKFYRRAEDADIPRELSHPHILRHSRAIELLQAGVPLITVQQLLGHTLSSTTAIYLQCPQIAAKQILDEKGLL